jgi:phosphohistidine swiveling domain-containing protein
LILFISAVAGGMASWNFLNMLSSGAPATMERTETHHGIYDLVLQVTRGMPYNPTTEMDLRLWDMAKTIRRDPPAMHIFQTSSTAQLAARYQAGDLPAVILQAVNRFLARYGGRGLGEIDLGRTRWAEDPTHVFEMLGSFVQIENEKLAPDVVFASGAGSAKQAVNQLAQAVRKTRLGWLKAGLVRFFAGRARQMMGARESPKFFAVRMMYLVHRELLKAGQEFVQAGELDQPDDLFYLTFAEMKALAAGQAQDWRGLIAARRAAYRRELMRRQIPRLLLSDGRAFYEGMSAPNQDANAITGSPVSPGSAEGRVRVVLDPRQAHLLPGEIMVCPGTDPSWTPLFLSAGGLVMETGGMMTHGAVVAREYGIPAIVGVDKATLRLHTGQRIRINGSSGQIQILEETEG